MMGKSKILSLDRFSEKKFKQYMRDCKLCGQIYWTDSKYGRMCVDCKRKNPNLLRRL